MALMMLQELARYECLLKAAKEQPDVEQASCEVFLNLLRTGDAVKELEDRYLSQHGITPGRFALMLLFGTGESVSFKPSQLAEMTGVTRATITGLLDTLERDGLVRRRANKEDRRSLYVESTPECRALLRSILPGYFRFIAAVSALLTDSEREQFGELSRKIREGLVLAEAKFITNKRERLRTPDLKAVSLEEIQE